MSTRQVICKGCGKVGNIIYPCRLIICGICGEKTSIDEAVFKSSFLDEEKPKRLRYRDIRTADRPIDSPPF